MRVFLFFSVLSIAIASGCARQEPRPAGTARTTGRGTGATDTGGGTMNNPTGVEGAGGTRGATAGTTATAPTSGNLPAVTPPGTGSVSSTAGPEGGEAGGGTAAASPANQRGTGTGTTVR